jgi:hypothetical protein
MRLLALLRWDLVHVARGGAAPAAISVVALASAGLVGVGIGVLALWSPFTLTPTTGTRTDPSSPPLLSILGEHRGGVAFLIILLWLLLVTTAIGPAFAAGTIVRDRRVGRLDRILLDSGRADLVALVKLGSAVLPVGLALLVAGPATSFAWLIGGLATPDALADVVTLVTLIVLIVAIGLTCAAATSTEAAAVLASYCAAGLVFWGPLLVGVALGLAGLPAVGNVVTSFDPAIALLAGQPDLMRALAHLLPGSLPAPPIVWTIATPLKIEAPVWAVDAVLYALLTTALVWLAGVILEPLHPIKTRRLRRAAAEAAR